MASGFSFTARRMSKDGQEDGTETSNDFSLCDALLSKVAEAEQLLHRWWSATEGVEIEGLDRQVAILHTASSRYLELSDLLDNARGGGASPRQTLTEMQEVLGAALGRYGGTSGGSLPLLIAALHEVSEEFHALPGLRYAA